MPLLSSKSRDNKSSISVESFSKGKGESKLDGSLSELFEVENDELSVTLSGGEHFQTF